MYCKDCKHWSKNQEDDSRFNDSPKQLGLGRCLNTPQLWDCYDWVAHERETTLAFIDEVVEKDIRAFVKDGSDYHADLYTLPNFGCVSFKEQEERNNGQRCCNR